MMNPARLIGAALFAIAPAISASVPAAGVVLEVNGHVTVERAAAGSETAQLGMRLEAADVVVVDRGATAAIYLKGGGVVRLADATRFSMPKAPDEPRDKATKLSSGSIAQLESGLWVLNDPQGSLLVSPMRGDGALDAADAAVPLSPRYEVLTEPSATFVWNGGPEKARVVVAKQREVVWRSPASPADKPLAARDLKLAAGEVYTWWLEPEAGGPPLTAGTPFRVAAADVIDRTRSLENELRAIPGDGSDYLRIAHYAGASSWTRVLVLATRMAPGVARARALDAAAAGLRLDARVASALAARLAPPVQ